MLFQPANMALLLADGLGLLLLLPTGAFAIRLLRHWDLASGSARQIRLEQQTYLASTVIGVVLLTQALALMLFVVNANALAVQFVGAMCAVGTLNVNAWGFPALLLRIGLFFLAATWLVLNHIDQRAPDYPLIRAKYALLLGLIPLALAAALAQLGFFLGLDADVITSCCGSLFSSDAEAVTAELAALPPLPVMIAFYAVLATTVASGLAYVRRRRGLALFSAMAALAFPVSIAAVIAFVSLYVYEHPHHHCPFCWLKPEYHFVGYAFFLPLFIATALGLGLGAARLLARAAGARAALAQVAPTAVSLAAALFALVALLALVLTWRSNLILLGN